MRHYPHPCSALFVASTLLLCALAIAHAQEDKSKRPSPPATATTTFNGVTVTVNYSQPAKKGREIFGKLVPYGEVWRTGANEATTITLSRDAMINGKALKAGTYALFTIPNKSQWTIIINSDAQQWGAYNYNQAKDILRTDVPVATLKEPVERFTINFEQSKNGSILVMMWDTTKVSVPIHSK
ncbi:MAG: DUF2911 domain-containing protein [Bacteroidota bacterium]|nr:DUF2911 domain-containing protein [Candidatus Kapabacteria bacterium]MDW8219737.1 DUF2911 domain-containing protein [Bacteroidota bacterium]